MEKREHDDVDGTGADDRTDAADSAESEPTETEPTAEARTADAGRNETLEERADRRWGDLLQELRVAQTGVQILFGFLLTVVFQSRFTELSDTDRRIYVVTVLLGAATTGALIGPVSMHRLLTGRKLKPETVRWASRLTVLGLVLLLCTMASSLLLVLRQATLDGAAAWLVGGMVAWFALWWFVLPLWARHRSDPGERI